MRRSFILFFVFFVLAACSSSSSDGAADAGHGDGGPTDGGAEGGTGDDGGGEQDSGPTIVGKGASCGTDDKVCGPGLYCKHGTGPMMFVGVCEDQLKEGDPCVIDSPAGKVDGGGCGTGLVCDIGLDQCVKKPM